MSSPPWFRDVLALVCAVLGHRPPPPPLDMLAVTLMGTDHKVPCPRCGTKVALERRADGKIVVAAPARGAR